MRPGLPAFGQWRPRAGPSRRPLSQHCLSEIEILAIIFAAAIHDYEHTGTTNSFHIQTK